MLRCEPGEAAEARGFARGNCVREASAGVLGQPQVVDWQSELIQNSILIQRQAQTGFAPSAHGHVLESKAAAMSFGNLATKDKADS